VLLLGIAVAVLRAVDRWAALTVVIAGLGISSLHQVAAAQVGQPRPSANLVHVTGVFLGQRFSQRSRHGRGGDLRLRRVPRAQSVPYLVSEVDSDEWECPTSLGFPCDEIQTCLMGNQLQRASGVC